MLLFGIRPHWYGLNIIRAVSIATLAVVIASSIVVMIRDANAICREMNTPSRTGVNQSSNKSGVQHAYISLSTVPLQPGGPFFAILSRLLIVCQCSILILAEIEWPKGLFTKFVPILGPGYGVGMLGAIQVLISAVILSHHIPIFALVPALLLFAIGCLNVILGLVFRKSIHSYRARTTDGLRDDESKETQSFNRRMSFRPGSKRPGTQSSAASSTIHTDIKTHLEPPYESKHGSKSGGHGYSEMPTYQDTSSQQCAEVVGEAIPLPEQARPKH